ncbi:MAG: FMN-binding protein [Lachnospiraceae bacterium]|nr:FMN-binding protein [Lachnospiraceae bacterium]
MKSKKSVLIIGMLLSLAALTAGCGGSKSYADGTYEGKSEVFENEDGSEEGNGYGVVSITIKDNQIVDCTFQTYEPDGTLKGEDYGKADGAIANKDYYNKAQKAVAACEEYANMLVANGQLDGIDAISGATINYGQFQEAVKDALKQAEN